jgi:tryptophan-rich sensory protein
MTGPPTGAFHTPVYTARPRHDTSFGMPTFTDRSVPTHPSSGNTDRGASGRAAGCHGRPEFALRLPATRRTMDAMAIPTLVKTAAAVTATALLGAVSTDPRSGWYEGLNKPSWQPPPAAFGAVWTPLYALIAVGGARVMDRTSGEERRGFGRAYTVNLALNAAWTPLFFGAKAPLAALVDVAALNVSNAHLLRRAWRADRPAAACLAPYVAWTYFASALNIAIVHRNRR